jgi:hypothetical protein
MRYGKKATVILACIAAPTYHQETLLQSVNFGFRCGPYRIDALYSFAFSLSYFSRAPKDGSYRGMGAALHVQSKAIKLLLIDRL